jgi:2'-5' RNA ligase
LDESATLDVWLLEPSAEVKTAAARLQLAFAHLAWIERVPPHFLHVTVGHEVGGSFDGIEPFEISFGRVTCFNEAVVVEVAGDGPRRLAERLGEVDLFLPHLTVGYVRDPGPSDDVRTALVPLREVELGTQQVEEVLLCHVPASRTTILRPWAVIERVHLQR